MSVPRRRLTYSSKAILPVSARVEKPRSPAPREVPVWVQGYLNRLQEARREYLLLESHEEREEAVEGQGEVTMTEVNSDLVQNQLLELAQQVMHVVPACNEEKEIIKDDFESSKKIFKNCKLGYKRNNRGLIRRYWEYIPSLYCIKQY